MTSTVLILGGRGRLGNALCLAFHRAGWETRVLVRQTADSSGSSADKLSNDTPDEQFEEGITVYFGDVRDTEALAVAARDCDVIVNAVNPPYQDWASVVPAITASVVAVARQYGATVMIPGNVYNYGAEMPALLTANTPQQPSNELGRLRVAMEASYREAAKDGMQSIVLRAGDFIEGRDTGNWFESHIARNIDSGRVMYPGPLDIPHAWAYVPDLAQAFVALAELRDSLDNYEDIGFPGFTMTGSQLIDALESHAGKRLKRGSLPWPVLRLMGLFSARMRGVVSMRYLWTQPHAIDGAQLKRLLPELVFTPLSVALQRMKSFAP